MNKVPMCEATDCTNESAVEINGMHMCMQCAAPDMPQAFREARAQVRAEEVMAKVRTRADRLAVSELQTELNKVNAQLKEAQEQLLHLERITKERDALEVQLKDLRIWAKGQFSK